MSADSHDGSVHLIPRRAKCGCKEAEEFVLVGQGASFSVDASQNDRPVLRNKPSRKGSEDTGGYSPSGSRQA